jgi:hypothetical protein
MHWSCDRTGFPVLELPAAGVAVHLLPVAKVQFERFLAEPVLEPAVPPEPARFGDSWYETILEVSPRVPLWDETIAECEPLFLAGILPTEATQFADWLGEGFDLPSANVWRDVDRAIREKPLGPDEPNAIRADPRLHRNARWLVDRVIRLRRPATWGQLMLLDHGLLEWVRTGPQTFGGLGRPRPELQKLILNPQRDAPVRPIREGRYRYFGFRMVRPM